MTIILYIFVVYFHIYSIAKVVYIFNKNKHKEEMKKILIQVKKSKKSASFNQISHILLKKMLTKKDVNAWKLKKKI